MGKTCNQHESILCTKLISFIYIKLIYSTYIEKNKLNLTFLLTI